MCKSHWQGTLKSEVEPKPAANVEAEPQGPGPESCSSRLLCWGEGEVFWPELQGRVQEARLWRAVLSP